MEVAAAGAAALVLLSIYNTLRLRTRLRMARYYWRPRTGWRSSHSFVFDCQRSGDRWGPARRCTYRAVRLIADKAYDSDALPRRLAARGIYLVSPHRRNRRRCRRSQGGRKLRRNRRRWKIERTFAWLGNLRRLVVRYDRLLTVYQGFFHLARIIIVLRYL